MDGKLICAAREALELMKKAQARELVWAGFYEDMKRERDEARARVAELEEAVSAHNDKMGNLQAMTLKPSSVEDGLRFLANWFDAMYGDAGTGRDEVQRDLRAWALDIINLRLRVAKLEKEQDDLGELLTLTQDALDACDPPGTAAELDKARIVMAEAHLALDYALGDTDFDPYEQDEDMREDNPVLWAAMKIAGYLRPIKEGENNEI